MLVVDDDADGRGYTDPEDRAHSLAAGYQGYLRKPARPAEIAAAVASMSTRRAASRRT